MNRTIQWRSSFIILIVFISLGFTSCEAFLDVNTNPDSPNETEVTEKVLLPGIEGIVSYNLVGGYPARYPNYWLGQLSSNREAPCVETFAITSADVSNTWAYDIYSGALKNDVLLMKKAQTNKNYHYLGISQVLAAYILAYTTDLWGDIPWSEAFRFAEITKPRFDKQEFIYTEIFRLLDDGIDNLNVPVSQQLYPGKDDLLFNGNIGKWVRLANTLKARYAMRLSYAPGKSGAAQADIALASLANAFRDNTDEASFQYFALPGKENPWYQFGVKWNSVYANDFLLNMMKKHADPRISIYFLHAEMTDTIAGHRNGNLIPSPGRVSLVVGNGINGNTFYTPLTQSDASLVWVSFAEAKFVEAEAWLWKSNYAKAETSMKEAITANMTKLGIPSSEITGYLSGLDDFPFSFEAAQKLIIEQKYIANFLSAENWNDYRRTGYPSVSADDTDNPEYGNLPLRFMYPQDVLLNNAANMPETDWLIDRLWWDRKRK